MATIRIPAIDICADVAHMFGEIVGITNACTSAILLNILALQWLVFLSCGKGPCQTLETRSPSMKPTTLTSSTLPKTTKPYTLKP